MAESETGGANVSGRLKKYLRETPFFCKIIQLLFCIIAIGLLINIFGERMFINYNHAAVIYTTLCGYIMINLILIICYLLGEKLSKKLALMFSGAGIVMTLATGIILIHDVETFQNNYISRYFEQYLKQMRASGIFSILTSIFFIIETYFTYKYE